MDEDKKSEDEEMSKKEGATGNQPLNSAAAMAPMIDHEIDDPNF